MGDRSYTMDVNLQLADGVAAMTAAGFTQFGGADGVIDFGGNQSSVPKLQPRIEGMLVINLSAITTTGSDEYRLVLLGSNDPNFGVGACEELVSRDFGAAAADDGTNRFVTPQPLGAGLYPFANMYELGFCTEQNNVKYQYVKLYVSGTFGSIQFSAFVAVTPQGG